MIKIQFQKFIAAFAGIATLWCCTLFGQYQSYQGQQYYPIQPNYSGQPYTGQIIQGQAYGQPVYPNQTDPGYSPGQLYPRYDNHASSPAQTLTTSHWAQLLKFGDRMHDFGAVPTASKQEHVFEFENTLDEEIFLTGVRASCGCTKPRLLTQSVKPGETGRVLAVFDTLSFHGDKAATVTVSLQKHAPYTEYGEIQFSVKGRIRQDVVLNPSKIQFEGARPNEDSQRTVEVKYAGDSRWSITDVKSSNSNITVESREINRDLATGRVTYELLVKLSGEQPIGMFSDFLTLITNDQNPNSKQMVVPVEGNVQAILRSSPVRLGIIHKGDRIKRKIVVRGEQAFRIKEIVVGNQRIKVEPADGEKSLHILECELDTTDVGQVDCDIKVVADLPGLPMTTIPFSAQIVQPIANDR
jgi:hypothetical protein